MIEKTLVDVRKLLRIVVTLLSFTSVLLAMTLAFHFNPKLVDFINPKGPEWHIKSIIDNLPEGERGETIKYGHRIITRTFRTIGPLNSDTAIRFAGNNLSCSNCHLNAGKKIGAGSFVGVANRFPQFRGRENKVGTLAERINGCMERSMNGHPMPESSKEMQAIIQYIEWLSEDVPPEVDNLYQGYVKITIPNFMADTVRGKALFDEKCQVCHGDGAKGIKKPGDQFIGYLYPPLAGPDSYNDAAGMARIITAAQFIKGNMPLGATYEMPQVSDEEAYHLAAYINSLERPKKSDKELDFPDKRLKPVSTPYGPWSDNFPAFQHKYGPFQPIMNFYKKKYNLVKSK